MFDPFNTISMCFLGKWPGSDWLLFWIKAMQDINKFQWKGCAIARNRRHSVDPMKTKRAVEGQEGICSRCLSCLSWQPSLAQHTWRTSIVFHCPLDTTAFDSDILFPLMSILLIPALFSKQTTNTSKLCKSAAVLSIIVVYHGLAQSCNLNLIVLPWEKTVSTSGNPLWSVFWEAWRKISKMSIWRSWLYALKYVKMWWLPEVAVLLNSTDFSETIQI